MSFIRRLCQPVCRNLHWKLSASSQLQIHSRFHNNVTPFCSILLSGNQCVGFPSTSSVFSSEASRRLIHQRGGRKGGPRDTMSKILLQAQSPDEIFRLVTQNPSKIYPNHLSIAIRYSAELCQKYEVTPDFLNSQSFQTICDNLALHCSTLHNRSLIRTVQSMMILRVPRDHVLLIALLNECGARMASLDLIDQSRLLEYMNIMQLKGNKVRDLCVRHVSSQLNEVRNHRAIVPLLDYYNSEYAFEEENTSHENITSEEEKSQDANYSTISQHIINIIHKFLQLNNAPMKHDLLKIGNLLAFTFKWHSFNQELIDILLCNRTFFFFRHNKLIESLGNEIPKYLNNVHPSTMILVAKYISHHAVRNTALLDVLSEYIILRGHYVGLEDVQKIILPIGKLNYIPETHEGLLNKMEDVILQQYKDSPVSVINVVMSLVQMQCFPESVLKIMFLPEFIQSVFDRHVQYDDIEVKLALIDQAVGLDCPNYDGPRLHEEIKVVTV
ncbi:FAST kinase domain-containing protein 3, mitochondrial-like [Glandiceps talaboti]